MMPPTRGQAPPPGYSWMQGAPPDQWHGSAMQRPPHTPLRPGDPPQVFGARPPALQGSPYGPPGADPYGRPLPSGPASFGTGLVHGKSREEEVRPPLQVGNSDIAALASIGNSDIAALAAAPDTTSQVAGGETVAAGDGSDEEVSAPTRTVADRFRNLRIVQNALSEKMLAYLQKAAVPLATSKAPASSSTEEVGLAENAAATRECARLGLDGSAQRARLPMPGPLKLPVCTVELQHIGLWDRFRQRCRTPMPSEPPPVQCEVKRSRGGGSVVVPHVVAAGPGPTMIPVSA